MGDGRDPVRGALQGGGGEPWPRQWGGRYVGGSKRRCEKGASSNRLQTLALLPLSERNPDALCTQSGRNLYPVWQPEPMRFAEYVDRHIDRCTAAVCPQYVFADRFTRDGGEVLVKSERLAPMPTWATEASSHGLRTAGAQFYVGGPLTGGVRPPASHRCCPPTRPGYLLLRH